MDTEPGDECRYLKPGTLLSGGRYRITRFIGSGGFGCTYEAVHTLFETRMVVKEFFVSDFCNRDADSATVSVGVTAKRELASKLRRKFINEARKLKALEALNNPHIVKVSDLFEENGTAYYVMAYIEGESLQQKLHSEGQLSSEQALRYISQVCDALTAVHDANMLHLDIKPGNIMIDSAADRAVLIDFGAAKQYDEASGQNTSTVSGYTPGYAPVEQMSNDMTEFTAATDIYALGATLYCLITGHRPPNAARLSSGSETLPPLPAGTHPGIAAAIGAAMQSSIRRRPQSVAAFRALLSASDCVDVEETVPVDNDEETIPDILPASGPKKNHKPAPRSKPKTKPAHVADAAEHRPSRRKLWIALAAGVVIGVAILAAVVSMRSGGTDPLNDTVAMAQPVIDEPADASANKVVIGGIEFVDLGLPSGNLWAKLNVGATTSSSNDDFGSYLTFNEAVYSANSGWTVPSPSDFQELIDNCNSEWLVGESATVLVLESRVNGNSIKFPAGGYKTEKNGKPQGNGYCCSYWSGEKANVSDLKYEKYFYADSASLDVSGSTSVDYLMNVRPIVRQKQ